MGIFQTETCTLYSAGGKGTKTSLGTVDLHIQPIRGSIRQGMAAKYPEAEYVAYYEGDFPYTVKEKYELERADSSRFVVVGVEAWSDDFDYTALFLRGDR